MSVTIREAEASETPTIGAMMKGYEAETAHVKVDVEHAAHTYAEMVRNGSATLFVLENNGEMIGGLGCVKNRDVNDGALIAVELYWFVHPDHRGHGLKLLNHFESWATAQKCKRVLMMHLSDSMPETLRSLYERMGFVEVERTYMKEL